MSPILFPKTEMTPLVQFEPRTNVLMVEGKLIPNDVEEVFSPINKWIDEYLKGDKPLEILFRLYYFNTSSFKRLFNLCNKLNVYFKQGKKVSVRWEYLEDDETGKPDAEQLLEAAQYPYQIVSVKG